jgi:uncharacterized protein (TIGR02271 family)
MAPKSHEIAAWRGETLADTAGDKIGTIEDIYLDRESGQPEWLAVKTGLFGSNVSFVPIRDASKTSDGVRVPYDKDKVKDAPNVEADGELTPDEERRLYEHYSLEWGNFDYERDDRQTDDAMTRSEEELRVGKTKRETGRARLRKYVVTENVETTVPVQREEVRVEREPITDANVDQATSGPDISEAEHEVTLHAEEPVVEKRTVPKERVRLDKDIVTEEQTVSDEVRKERIEADTDTTRRDRR